MSDEGWNMSDEGWSNPTINDIHYFVDGSEKLSEEINEYLSDEWEKYAEEIRKIRQEAEDEDDFHDQVSFLENDELRDDLVTSISEMIYSALANYWKMSEKEVRDAYNNPEGKDASEIEETEEWAPVETFAETIVLDHLNYWNDSYGKFYKEENRQKYDYPNPFPELESSDSDTRT